MTKPPPHSPEDCADPSVHNNPFRYCPYCTWVDPVLRREATTRSVLNELAAERERQTAKHGDQAHLPDGTGPDVRWLQGAPRNLLAVVIADEFRALTKAHSQNEGGDGSVTFLDILREEVAEAFAEDDPAKLRAELVQVAAVAVQWVEAIDRRIRGR